LRDFITDHHDLGVLGPLAAAQQAWSCAVGGYVSDENYWMLRHHQAFATFVPADAPEPERELPWHRWRDHPAAKWTSAFVNHYDQNAVDPAYGNLPLQFFEPMVRGIFSRTPKPLRLDS
jgi:hypothetical protein